MKKCLFYSLKQNRKNFFQHHIFFLSLAILSQVIAQQPKDSLVPPDGPSEDYIDRGQDGSYRFGYKNLDLGGHYHSAVASRDNTVAGR